MFGWSQKSGKRTGNQLHADGIHFSSLVKQVKEPTKKVQQAVLRHVGIRSTLDNCERLYNALESARRACHDEVLLFRLTNGTLTTFTKPELQIHLKARGKRAKGNKELLWKRVRFCCNSTNIESLWCTCHVVMFAQLQACVKDRLSVPAGTPPPTDDMDVDEFTTEVNTRRNIADKILREGFAGSRDTVLPDPCTLGIDTSVRPVWHEEQPPENSDCYAGGKIRTLQELQDGPAVVHVGTIADNKDHVRRLVCEYTQQQHRHCKPKRNRWVRHRRVLYVLPEEDHMFWHM